MGRNKAILFPRTQKKLEQMGEQIKYARLRRHMSSEDVAIRANINRMTVSAIEHGSPSVSIGMYLAVLNVLGLEDDILLIARDDVMGRTYQDLELKIPKRIKKGSE